MTRKIIFLDISSFGLIFWQNMVLAHYHNLFGLQETKDEFPLLAQTYRANSHRERSHYARTIGRVPCTAAAQARAEDRRNSCQSWLHLTQRCQASLRGSARFSLCQELGYLDRNLALSHLQICLLLHDLLVASRFSLAFLTPASLFAPEFPFSSGTDYSYVRTPSQAITGLKQARISLSS